MGNIVIPNQRKVEIVPVVEEKSFLERTVSTRSIVRVRSELTGALEGYDEWEDEVYRPKPVRREHVLTTSMRRCSTDVNLAEKTLDYSTLSSFLSYRYT